VRAYAFDVTANYAMYGHSDFTHDIVEELCCFVIATKEIDIGEEVLLVYGYSYWTTMNS
jgi:hypothetical protein